MAPLFSFIIKTKAVSNKKCETSSQQSPVDNSGSSVRQEVNNKFKHTVQDNSKIKMKNNSFA